MSCPVELRTDWDGLPTHDLVILIFDLFIQVIRSLHTIPSTFAELTLLRIDKVDLISFLMLVQQSSLSLAGASATYSKLNLGTPQF